MIPATKKYTIMWNWATFIYFLPFYIYLLLRAILYSLVSTIGKVPKDFSKETILITGSASGIGRQTTYQFVRKFPTATYVLWDINEKELKKTAHECRLLGAINVHTFVVNLAVRENINEVANKVRETVGSVTVLFNNAGIARTQPFLDADPSYEEMVIKVNLLSYMWTLREFLPDMVEKGKGHVICMCSALAGYRYQTLTSYCASKYGLRGFLETLQLEIREHPKKPNISFSTVYPGVVNTPLADGQLKHDFRYNVKGLQPMDPKHVARCIIDGILKEEKTIVIPNFYKYVDIFYRILPTEFWDSCEKHLYIPLDEKNKKT